MPLTPACIIRGPVSVMTSAQAACDLPFLQGADSPMQVPCRHSKLLMPRMPKSGMAMQVQGCIGAGQLPDSSICLLPIYLQYRKLYSALMAAGDDEHKAGLGNRVPQAAFTLQILSDCCSFARAKCCVKIQHDCSVATLLQFLLAISQWLSRVMV